MEFTKQRLGHIESKKITREVIDKELLFLVGDKHIIFECTTSWLSIMYAYFFFTKNMLINKFYVTFFSDNLIIDKLKIVRGLDKLCKYTGYTKEELDKAFFDQRAEEFVELEEIKSEKTSDVIE